LCDYFGVVRHTSGVARDILAGITRAFVSDAEVLFDYRDAIERMVDFLAVPEMFSPLSASP
jgi:hypothetical protein